MTQTFQVFVNLFNEWRSHVVFYSFISGNGFRYVFQKLLIW